jgi:hypothetical protein
MTLAQYIACGILVAMASMSVVKSIVDMDKRAEDNANSQRNQP